MERVTRIELALTAWEAAALPLSYTRAATAKITQFVSPVKPQQVDKSCILWLQTFIFALDFSAAIMYHMYSKGIGRIAQRESA